MRVLASLLVLVAAVCTAGCQSVRVNPRGFTPAFLTDVDDLRKDHDEAIAKVRADEDSAIASVRTDLTASQTVGKKAYDDAIAAGKTATEALADKFKAEAAEQRRLTDIAITEATTKAKTANDVAIGNVEKGSTSPLGAIVYSLLAAGMAGVAGWLKLKHFDSLPFIGPNGEKMPEQQVVAAVMGLPTPPKTG